MVETGDGQEVVVDIGGGARAGEGPELEEAVIDEVKGFGLVAKAVLAMRAGGWIGFGGVGVVSGLVGAGVVHIGRLRVARGGKAAVGLASLGVAGAAFFAILAGRARAGGGRQGTGRGLVDALGVGAGADQLAVGGHAHPSQGWVARKGGVGGNQSIGHQALGQAGLAGC
ncbi:MAG: hypothetical protein LLG42_06540 [Chloroflexi bacterium]|nr:hypothetical protein [Chloroflexota bacterium]